MPAPTVLMDLHEEIEKKNTPTPIMYAQSMEIIYGKWGKYVHIYTDGSKDQNDNTGAAVYIPRYNVRSAKKVSSISIFRAEQTAIIMALEFIRELNIKQSVIFCDSLSVLCDLKELNTSKKTTEIRQLLYQLKELKLDISFEWIPSHCGIAGNEIVDGLAKEALKQSNETNIPLNKTEMNNIIFKHYMEHWQNEWEKSERGRFLYHIQPTIKPTFQSHLNCRREESIIHRLRIGSCLLNETLYKLKRHDSGKCSHCDVPETVPHYLLDCSIHNEHRQELQYNLSVDNLTLRNILSQNKQRHLIHFVKQTGKYNVL